MMSEACQRWMEHLLEGKDENDNFYNQRAGSTESHERDSQCQDACFGGQSTRESVARATRKHDEVKDETGEFFNMSIHKVFLQVKTTTNAKVPRQLTEYGIVSRDDSRDPPVSRKRGRKENDEKKTVWWRNTWRWIGREKTKLKTESTSSSALCLDMQDALSRNFESSR